MRYSYKQQVLAYLLTKVETVDDLGTQSDQSCDYPILSILLLLKLN